MKTPLLALAALMAGGAALAQSSVTLYGVADVGIGKQPGASTQMVSGSWVNNSASYLGFRGVEDLGGGLKAGFNFEQGLSLENGATDDQTAGNNPNYGRAMFQRAANLWLGGSWGTFKMGRAYTPSRNALAAWEIMGMPTYATAVTTFGVVGGETDHRNNSQFSYKTPDLSGFSAEIGYVMKADNNDRSKVDVGLIYVNGPLSAGLSFNKTKDMKANYALGALYNFGNFALSAGYFNTRNLEATYVVNGQTIANRSGQANGVTLGGSVNFGAMSLALNVGRQTKLNYIENGVRVNDKKRTNATLEAKYAMSKRTFAYAVYMRSWDENFYGVGLQHGF